MNLWPAVPLEAGPPTFADGSGYSWWFSFVVRLVTGLTGKMLRAGEGIDNHVLSFDDDRRGRIGAPACRGNQFRG